MKSNGLLAVLTRPPQGQEQRAEFTAWYDEEHAPARLAVPGITTARRYQEIERPDEYLALYDLDAVSTLDSKEYQTLREAPAAREVRVLGSLALLDRRIYRSIATRPISNSENGEICGEYLVCMWWTPDPNTEQDFHAWYDEEHVPLLMRIPGWQRIRRYKLETGSGTKFLAVHDLATIDAMSHELFTAAVETPWRDRLLATAKERDRRVYQLLRRFD